VIVFFILNLFFLRYHYTDGEKDYGASLSLLQESLRLRDDDLTASDLPRIPGLPDLTVQSAEVPREVSNIFPYVHYSRRRQSRE